MISTIDTSKCTGCGICVEVCPLDTLRLDINRDTCPPCSQSCPAGMNVRAFLSYLKQGMTQQASACLYDALPFPALTGILCHHPCEIACARRAVDEALSIKSLEHFIGLLTVPEAALNNHLRHPEKVAVIGSGPAGLSTAYFLRKRGYTVTVFESEAELGGSLLRAARDGYVPIDVLETQMTTLKSINIEFTHQVRLFKDTSLAELRKERYEAILLAIGSSDSLPGPLVATDETKEIRFEDSTSGEDTKGVFAAGGLLSGPKPFVSIIASGKRSASTIDRYFRKTQALVHATGHKAGVKRIPSTAINKSKRLLIKEHNTLDFARIEANRCMSCGSVARVAYPEDCMTCFECEVKCPSNAVKVHPFKELLPMTLSID